MASNTNMAVSKGQGLGFSLACDDTTGSPAKWYMRNKHRNSILMTHNYPNLGRASDWMKQISNQSEALPRSVKWCVIDHYGIFEHFSQTSFYRETISGIMKSWLFFSMNLNHVHRKQKENRTKITSWLFNTCLLTAYPQQRWPWQI